MSEACRRCNIPLRGTQIRRGLLEWYDEHHRVLPWRRNFHNKRPSEEGGLSGAPRDLPLDEFMYYVMVCEVGKTSTYVFQTTLNALMERHAERRYNDVKRDKCHGASLPSDLCS